MIQKFENFEGSESTSELEEKIEFIKRKLNFMKSYDFDGMTPDQYLNEGCTELEFACIQIAQKLGMI